MPDFPPATEAYLDGLRLAGPLGTQKALSAQAVLREARTRTMLAFIHAWSHSRGECRTIWRREALDAIRTYRRAEHQAFIAYQAALTRSRERRT